MSEQRCTNPHHDTSDPHGHCWHEDACCHCGQARPATILAAWAADPSPARLPGDHTG